MAEKVPTLYKDEGSLSDHLRPPYESPSPRLVPGSRALATDLAKAFNRLPQPVRNILFKHYKTGYIVDVRDPGVRATLARVVQSEYHEEDVEMNARMSLGFYTPSDRGSDHIGISGRLGPNSEMPPYPVMSHELVHKADLNTPQKGAINDYTREQVADALGGTQGYDPVVGNEALMAQRRIREILRYGNQLGRIGQ